ncbi:hypothetical protein ACFTWJ_35660, partial [Streptomyces anthocyanicus]
VAFCGGGEIDLRDADFAAGEVVINCVAIMGGMNVVVPPGVEVVVRGIGFMGGFDHSEEGVPGDPGAPRVIVTGFAFWGGVGVERKVTRAERQRLKEERRQEKLERRQERERERLERGSGRRELDASRSDGHGRHGLGLHDLHGGRERELERERERRRDT